MMHSVSLTNGSTVLNMNSTMGVRVLINDFRCDLIAYLV